MNNRSRRTAPLPPGWGVTRKRILQRAGGRCAEPGCTDRATDVDHIVAVSAGGSEADANLQALCRQHHNRKTSQEANTARWKYARLAKRRDKAAWEA